MSIFGSENVIIQKINESDLSSYIVGFDLDDNGDKEYRWEPLVRLLMNVIPEFSFGFHEGEVTDNTKLIEKITDAAKAVYKIDEFNKVKGIYLENDGFISDDDETKKYLKRGEFGELILHLLLRDFHNTIPLVSKIYFKDSYGGTVHGFDAVHVDPEKKTLWLGESKLYTDGKKGIKALIDDIKAHFKRDYLDDEFTIVTKKIKFMESLEERDIWLRLLNKDMKLSDRLTSINIPLVCTYTSDNFNKYNDEENGAFLNDYINEINELKTYFDNNNDHPLKDHLNVILILFPVQDKNQLIRKLHKQLYKMQSLGE